MPDGDVINFIHDAVDRGITFLDNSWDCNNGMREIRVGRAPSADAAQRDGRSLRTYAYRDNDHLGSSISTRYDRIHR